MNCLISTIVRNRLNTLPLWREQLISLVQHNQDISFDLSIYENDSIDGSKEYLQNYCRAIPGFHNITITSENLGTRQYGSFKNESRVKLLAQYRNRTLDQVKLQNYSKILVIEPDIRYCGLAMRPILISDADIISARSTSHTQPLYDGWATRFNEEDSDWNGVVPYTATKVWSTFSCFCCYQAQPIIDGIRFGHHNNRFQIYDCDTVIICEEFHKANYHNIILQGDITVEHI